VPLGPPVGAPPPCCLSYPSPSHTPPLTSGPVAAGPHLSVSTGSARCRLRPHRPEPFRPRGSTIDPVPPSSFSRSPPRIRRFGEGTGTSLRSILRPSSSSSPSPQPMCLSHWLPPLEIPPPLWFLSERHRLHRFTVRPPICHRCPHLRPPSPPLFRADTAGSCLHRRRPLELSPR
jgi:hypothetical protein